MTYTKSRLWLIILIIIGIALIALFLMPPHTTNIPNTESEINFLQQNKIIAPKEFSHILEPLLAKPSTQQIDVIESPKISSLTLSAILNNKALLNNKWVAPNEVVFFQDNEFTLIEIQNKNVILKNNTDSSTLTIKLFDKQKSSSFSLK
ncbi:hypothetical protein CQA66_05750 [Helicobacter aurati]|uniref:Uncharacterized protein n=1 Tax=Helicobacter aurati TaxID=137778 RepID=A0A3D8J4Z3_9HELI|nr:hypothetical protein [Helicobacter aurati]RDU71964.1 hypothetical protein CQA66_05750 [Helicobacter aurati]